VDDLITFLRAHLDEDEQAAREAIAKTTTSRRMIRGQMVTVPIVPRAWEKSAWPADRVLREVEAKRRIIEWHAISHECSGPDDNCMWVLDPSDCPTLRARALPYADPPNYQEEWRP
jgi:hypothetical protein